MFRLGVGFVTVLAVCSAAAQPCPALSEAVKVESERYTVLYRTRPDRIAIGKHFAMDVVVCPRSGGTPAPESLRVDAHMPEHKHGMNYRTTVKPAGAFAYIAEGFLFHMAGRWELVFEVRAEGRTDRMTRSVVTD